MDNIIIIKFPRRIIFVRFRCKPKCINVTVKIMMIHIHIRDNSTVWSNYFIVQQYMICRLYYRYTVINTHYFFFIYT